MKKRFYVTVVILLLLASLVCIPNMLLCAIATNITEFSVGNVSGKVGDTVTVPINISNNAGIIATRIHLQYDTSVLKLKSVQNGEIFEDRHATFNDDLTVSKFTMLWFNATSETDYTENGTLAVLTFEILENAQIGISEIELECDFDSTFNFNMDDVDVKTNNGSVEILADFIPIESLVIPETMEIKYKTTAKLNVTISPKDADEQQLNWKSSNPNVLEVDKNGNLTTNKKGTAVITVSTEDGKITDTCAVTVKYSFGQWLIIIFLFGWIWY